MGSMANHSEECTSELAVDDSVSDKVGVYPPVCDAQARISEPRHAYNRRGGRPRLEVDFLAVCNAVRRARQGNGETITSVAQRFGVSRAWIHTNVYPELGNGHDGPGDQQP